MTNSVEEYLDALVDAKEHLTTALESTRESQPDMEKEDVLG